MKQLYSLGGWRARSKLQLHTGDGALHLPRLECLVGNNFSKVLDSNISLVTSGLNSVKSVLPALGGHHAGAHLLQVSADAEGCLGLGTQTSSNTECVRNTSIVVGLTSGSSLQNNTQGGDRAVVLDRGDIQTVLESRDLQRLSFDKLAL